MENETKNNTGLKVIIVILILIIFGLLGWMFLRGGTVVKNEPAVEEGNKETQDNPQEETKDLSICDIENNNGSDKLEILSMENKTEKIAMVGGPGRGYNVSTTVTKEHNYTSTAENDELYTIDMAGTLYVLYKNELYYTSQKEIISKYCSSNGKFDWQKTCDYSKFSDDNIKEFSTISIDLNLKAIGTYGTSGSGSPRPYAITTDGKVIAITTDSSSNYTGCRVMYDDANYPIDRILNLYFYDGVEYTILLKDGTLITRDVDRENPIELNW